MAREKRSGDKVYRPGSYPANERGGRSEVGKAASNSDLNDASRNSSAGTNEKMPTFSDTNWAREHEERGGRRRDSDGDYD